MAAWRSKHRVLSCPKSREDGEEKTWASWKIGHQPGHVRRSSYGPCSLRHQEPWQVGSGVVQGDVIVGQVLKSPALPAEAVSAWQTVLRAGLLVTRVYFATPCTGAGAPALHRNAAVLAASSGVFNTPLGRQAGYLTPICFFCRVIYSSGWELPQQMNPCAHCSHPGRPSGSCSLLAPRFALGCSADTPAPCHTCLHLCRFWYFWLGEHRLEGKCSLKLCHISLLAIKPTNQTKAKQTKPKKNPSEVKLATLQTRDSTWNGGYSSIKLFFSVSPCDRYQMKILLTHMNSWGNIFDLESKSISGNFW